MNRRTFGKLIAGLFAVPLAFLRKCKRKPASTPLIPLSGHEAMHITFAAKGPIYTITLNSGGLITYDSWKELPQIRK
jgi:hypothetical protein